MGPYLSEPMTAKKASTQKFNHNKLIVTSCQMQGWRRQMEDAHIIIQLVQDSVYLFGIFDGHGGPQVAHFVAKMFPKQLLNQPHFKLKHYCKALTNVFKRMDELLLSARGETQLKRLQKVLQSKQNPEQPRGIISQKTGCTANVILLTKQKIYIANIGDSRSVLCRKGLAIALSQDHKPDNPVENDRIVKAGGKVFNGRINGGLNLSRSFGDFSFKSVPNKPQNQQLIISVPDIIEIDRKSKQDQFIIMGCDGIWEKYVHNSQQMVDLINKMNLKYDEYPPSKCARKKSAYIFSEKQNDQTRQTLMFNDMFTQFLGKTTQGELGCDNMTSILIQFATIY